MTSPSTFSQHLPYLEKASVKRSGAPRRSVADTQPLLKHYAQYHHLPNHFVFLWGYCHSKGHHDMRLK